MSDTQTPQDGLPEAEVTANIVQVVGDLAPVEATMTTTPLPETPVVVQAAITTVAPAVETEKGSVVPEYKEVLQPESTVTDETALDEAAEEAVVQSIPVPVQVLGTSSTVQQDHEIYKKDSNKVNGELKPNIVTLALPTTLPETISANLDHPSANVASTKGEVWANTIAQGEELRTYRGMFIPTVNREGAKFFQGLETGNIRLGYYSPKFSDREGQKLTGQNAVLRMRSLMGMGGLITIPLYHSGFHLTIKTPRDADTLSLKEQNEKARIKIGRMTFGMAFSNTSAYLVENIITLIRDHIYSSTLNVPDEEIISRISVLDLPVLVWGLACTQWPAGFQYARSNILGNTAIDQDIITGLIDLGKLLWVDNSVFTDKQKAQMSIRQQRQVTKEVQDLYKDQFISTAGRTVELKEDVISINLRVPSITEYIESSHRWIDALVQTIDSTFTGDRTDFEGRNRAMMNHANLSRMRQYSHWIRSITMEGVEYSEKDEIEQMLDTLSENDELREVYFTSIEKFINDSTIAVIAIPETSGKETNLPRFPHLIPIDVVGTFFTLLVHRLNRTLTEES